MRGPMSYDIRRTLTSKSTLAVIAGMVLISSIVLPSFTNRGSSGYVETQVFTYYDGEGYHFLAFAWNQFGQAMSGIIINVDGNSSNVLFSGAGTTNSSGVAAFDIQKSPDTSASMTIAVTQPGESGISVSGFRPFLKPAPNGTTRVPPGVPVSASGGLSLTDVIDKENASRRDIQAIWVGTYGSSPKGIDLYYRFQNSSYQGQLNESSMAFLGEMSGYKQSFPAPSPRLSKSATLVVGIFYANGTFVGQSNWFTVSDLFPPPLPPVSPSQGEAFVTQFLGGIFALAVPLIAVVGSYSMYGKDRASGVLESVLALPISRRGLSISRYLSSFIALAIALLTSVAFVDAITWHFTGSFVDSTLIVTSIGSFLADLAAFIGIMMILARIAKSSGLLLGLGVGVLMLFDFFWGLIVNFLATAGGISYGSAVYLQVLVASQFLSPAQLEGLTIAYLTHSTSFGVLSPANFPIEPSTYGITVPSLVVATALWVVIPLAIFLYLSVKRD